MYVDWSVELATDDPVLDFPWTVEATWKATSAAAGEATSEVAAEAPSSNAGEAVRDQGGSRPTTLRYYDLKADPGLIDQLPEAQSSSELRKFLLRVNAAGFPLQSAKCDHWFTREISEEEEIFGAPCKYGSYVDLLFTSAEKQFSFADHEEFAARLCDLLKGAPEMPASAEIMVRRCFYTAVPAPAANVEKDVERDVEKDIEKDAEEDAERDAARNAGSREEPPSVNTGNQNAGSPADGFYFTVYVSGFGETEAQARKQWSIALTLVQHALVQSCKSF